MIYTIYYIGICLIIGLLGINKKFGFWGYFFGAMLFSPLIGVILLLASDNRKVY
jgi:hypothetical protein